MTTENKILQLPPALSNVAICFFDDQFKLLELFNFVILKVAATTQTKFGDSTKKIPLKEAMEGHLEYFCILIFCKTIDNFQTYMQGMIRTIVCLYPKMYSANQFTLEEALKCEDMNALIEWHAVKQARSLAFKSIEELDKELLNRFKVGLFTNKDDLKRAQKLIEIRNVLTHNRGVVHSEMKKKVPEITETEGSHLSISGEDMLDCLDFTKAIVADFDTRMTKHFKKVITFSHNHGRPWYTADE